MFLKWLGMTVVCLNIFCSILTIINIVMICYKMPVGVEARVREQKWLCEYGL